MLAEDSNIRIESEFFFKTYVDLNKNVSKHGFDLLQDVTLKITDGTHYTPTYQESGIPFLSALNVKENHLEINDNYKFISLEEHLELYKRCDPKPMDVLLRKVGVGARMACVIPNNVFEFSLFVSVAQLRPDTTKVNPFFLATFINSNLGQKQLIRFNKGSSQPDLHLEEIRKLKVPRLNFEFQNKIAEIVLKTQAILKESKALYAEAENLLLDELGLRDWSPSDDSISVKSFKESFADTGRLDAEYYQPKYDYALERLRNLTPKPLDIVPLESLVKELTNGGTPLRHNLSEGEIPFLTAEHVFDFRINYASEKRITLEHHLVDMPRTRLKQNDIVIAIKGKVGNAAVVDNPPHEANINQDVGLFRLKDRINPYYIVGFLNSIIGKAFVEQISTGQINPFLGLGNLKTLKIPIFEPELMNELGKHLKEKLNLANTIAQQSKGLLEIAKRAVEMAIEESEDAAVEWINGKLLSGI